MIVLQFTSGNVCNMPQLVKLTVLHPVIVIRIDGERIMSIIIIKLDGFMSVLFGR